MKHFKFPRRRFMQITTSFIILAGLLIVGYKIPERNRNAGNFRDEHILYVKNPTGGPTLGYDSESGIKIIEADGFFFKDLNKNGKLDPYEDWRLPVDERAKNLASLM